MICQRCDPPVLGLDKPLIFLNLCLHSNRKSLLPLQADIILQESILAVFPLEKDFHRSFLDCFFSRALLLRKYRMPKITAAIIKMTVVVIF
jgi:hypothetical protein